jgi:hypothetical protein
MEKCLLDLIKPKGKNSIIFFVVLKSLKNGSFQILIIKLHSLIVGVNRVNLNFPPPNKFSFVISFFAGQFTPNWLKLEELLSLKEGLNSKLSNQ